MENFKTIERKIKDAISDLLEKDFFLLKNKVHERAISHKLAEHLQSRINSKDYNIDCEYNKKINNADRITMTTKKGINGANTYPDIIIHNRENREKNLLIIEIKPSHKKSEIENDKKKLKFFTSMECSYKYKNGLSIMFYTGKKKYKKQPVLTWFKDGEEKG